MDDLISRQAAIEEIAQTVEHDREGRCSLSGVLFKLKKLPTAEKRGKWILTDFPDEQTYKCSACNEIWTFIVGTPVDNGAFFCPNCGARMEN